MNATQRFLVVLMVGGTLVGCDPAGKAWETAQSENTIDAFEQYLAEFPDSEYSAEAELRIESLVWEEVQSLDTEQGYEAYAAEYPSGTYSEAANDRLRAIRLDTFLLEFGEHLMAFMRDEPSAIATLQGRTWSDLDPRVAIESGGFTRYNGQAIIQPGSVIVFVDRDDMFHIKCGIDEAQYADYAKPDTFESATFAPGATARLQSGEILEYSDEGWTYID